VADLAQRLDVNGRRIVVLAGPGDRRDEDLVAIAQAVAGRFEHYICRRDDNLRNRASDEVPRIQAAALIEAGVPKDAISVIPDEQEAIDAALKMGQAGDLLLIFADALARSWKQITKFKTVGSQAAPQGIAAPSAAPQTLRGVAARETASGGATGTAYSETAHSAAERWNGGGGSGEQAALSLEGLIRDERGVRFAPEAED
jgi:cyanophycin synthetase